MAYFIQSALENSPLLKEYSNQLLLSKLDSLQLRAVYGLQVNGISNNSYAPNYKGYGYDNAITNGGQVSALAGVSQQIVGRRNLRNQLQSISLQYDSLLNGRKISEQDLKKAIAAQYITAYGDLQQYSFNRDILHLLQEEEIVLKQLARTGVYKQTEYLTFLVTLQQQELLAMQAMNQYRNDFATLNYLCGLSDTAFTMLADPVITINVLPDPSMSIFFHRYVLDSLQLRNADRQIDYNYRLKSVAMADGGYNSTLVYQPYKNFGVSAGLNFNLPIYDGHQRRIQHNRISIMEQTRSYYADFFARQYDQQLKQLLQQLHAANALIEQAGIQIKYADGLLEADKKLLVYGDVRIADYVIALNNYLNAKNIITQNMVNKYQIINQINYWNRTK
ncbi:TolC family protein [Chitinophagaceae bacterium MMS25-I14]